MKRAFKVYFNRVTAIFYLGALLMSLMLFFPPQINVILLILSICVLFIGGAYVTEELTLTAEERLFLIKLNKIFFKIYS